METVSEIQITSYCLGTVESGCNNCQQKENWKLLTEMPNDKRLQIQSNCQKIDLVTCVMSGRPWFRPKK